MRVKKKGETKEGDGGAVVGVGHDGRTAANFGDDEDSWKTGSLEACDEAGVWEVWLVRGLSALGIGMIWQADAFPSGSSVPQTSIRRSLVNTKTLFPRNYN
jgi:hypothetical protein